MNKEKFNSAFAEYSRRADSPFKKDYQFKSNTSVRKSGDTLIFRYHNTDIVKVGSNGVFAFTMGGWGTVTTRDRINGLARDFGFGTIVCQRHHVQHVMDANGVNPIDKYGRYELRSIDGYVVCS